jgi:hypothetical protein
MFQPTKKATPRSPPRAATAAIDDARRLAGYGGAFSIAAPVSGYGQKCYVFSYMVEGLLFRGHERRVSAQVDFSRRGEPELR